jgi:hypothetical protein
VLFLLLKFVGVAVLTVVVTAVRMHRAHRRRAEVETGGTATCRAVLSMHDGRFRVGVLLLSGARVVWQSRRGDRPVELTGGRVLAVGAASQRHGRPDDVLLRLMLPGRVPGRLILQEDDAATLVELLPRTDPPLPGAELPVLPVLPVRGRRPWAIACLVLAALWTLVWVVVVLDGDTVRATITGGDGDGTCAVVFSGPDGRHHRSEVDCSDQPAGSEVTVWALGWPATGEAEDPAWTVGGVSVVGTLIATPGAVSLLRRRHRRLRRELRPEDGSIPEPVPPRVDIPLQDAPPLSIDDLRPLPHETPAETLLRLAPRAVRQIPVDGWEHPGLPAGDGPPQVFTQLLRAVRVPVAVLVVVVALSWLFAGSWYVLMGRPTSTAAGVSTGEVTTESYWPLPDRVTVRFATSGGGTHDADVATLESLPEGRQVTVEYAVGDPGAARLVGPADGLGRSAALTAGAVALVLLFIAYRVRSALAGVRAARAAAELPPNPAVGLLTADGDGRPLLVVCSPVGGPLELYTVPLETPLPHGTAALFVAHRPLELRVRGHLAEGVTVIPAVGAAVLWPAGPASLPDREELVVLLDSVGALGRSNSDD